MKTFCLLLLLLSGVAALAEEPSTHPATGAVDYEAHYLSKASWDKGPPRKVVVLHHEGLFREVKEDQGFNWLSYRLLSGFPSIDIRVGTDGIARTMRIEGPFSSQKRILEAYEKQQIARHQGDTCRFWEVVHRRTDVKEDGIKYLECYTLDGIQLVEKFPSHQPGEFSVISTLSKLKRRQVARHEVYPDKKLLDVSYWIGPVGSAKFVSSKRPDYVVKYEGSGSSVVRKRHFPWISVEVDAKGRGRELRGWNETNWAGWSVDMDERGRPDVFYIVNAVTGEQDPAMRTRSFDLVTNPEKMGKSDVILGEDCEWYNMAPNVADAGQHQCLTADKIPLAIEHTSAWSSSTMLIAVDVSRKSVRFDEVLPKQELFDPSFWGIPK